MEMSKPVQKTRSERRFKALDVLDKHMSQRSTLKKSLGANPANVFALNESMILSTAQEENVYQRSPTPRRVTASSENAAGQGNFAEIKPGRVDDSNSPPSSPIRKGVSFSDQVDSSPMTQQQMGSSPIRPSSMTKPPSKSILKHASLPHSKNDKNSAAGSPSKPSHLSIDPFSTSFWVEGEIRTMIHANNIAEFKKLIEGGMHVLNNGKSRDFEIYATFNNIIPSANGVILNDIVHLKNDFIIENMESLIGISLNILKRLQGSLLLQMKKDPFKSRCYIQVVRFLASLFSNFKAIKSLDGNLTLQLKFTEILKILQEVLVHENTNKVMVIYPLALIKEEKFGQFYFPETEIKALISSVINMKHIASTNVQCEKLMVLRQFLQKYTKPMLECLSVWFPAEVLSRYLSEDRPSSTKTRSCCNLIILDLLRKCLSNNNVQASVSIIESMPIAEFLDGLPDPTVFDPAFREISETGAVGEALCSKLMAWMDNKEEYKLSMDCWLGMVGLLFNSPQNLHLLLEPAGKRWIKVNDECLSSSDHEIKGMAIRNRRILNFMIITNMVPDIAEDVTEKLVSLLLKPFELPVTTDMLEYLQFALNGIIYLTCCDNSGMSTRKFGFLLKKVLRPLLQLIRKSEVFQLIAPKVHEIFSRVFGKLLEDDSLSPRKRGSFQPLKALSTVGIEVYDFEPIDKGIFEANWNSILELLQDVLEWPGAEEQYYFTILEQFIRNVPSSIPAKRSCETILKFFSKVLALNNSGRSTEPFKSTVRTLAERYELLLFDCCPIFLTEIYPMNNSTELVQFEYFKEILHHVKPFVKLLLLFGKFDHLDNRLISNYTANIVGSMLLPVNMTQNEYSSLMRLVNQTPTPEVIDNLFTWLRKTDNWGNIASELHLTYWDDHLFANFIHKWLHEQKGSWNEETVQLITESLWNKPIAFKELSSLLITSGQTKIIKNVLDRNPSIIDDVSILGDLSLVDVLPKPLIRSSLENIDHFDDVIKTKLFLCAAVFQQFDLLAKHQPLLFQLLLPTDDDVVLNSIRNKILDTLLVAEICERDFIFVSKIVEVLVLRNDAGRLESFISKWKCFDVLEPSTICLLLQKAEIFGPDLLNLIKSTFASSAPSTIISVTEGLHKRNKSYIFGSLKEELLSFCMDTANQLNDAERDSLAKVFPHIVEYFVVEQSVTLNETMKLLLNLLKTSKAKPHGSNLLLSFLNHPKFRISGNKTLMRRLNSHRANAKRKQATRKYKLTAPKEIGSSKPSQSPVLGLESSENGSLSMQNDNEQFTETSERTECVRLSTVSSSEQIFAGDTSTLSSGIQEVETDTNITTEREGASNLNADIRHDNDSRNSDDANISGEKGTEPLNNMIELQEAVVSSNIIDTDTARLDNVIYTLPRKVGKIPLFNPFVADVKLEDAPDVLKVSSVPLKRRRSNVDEAKNDGSTIQREVYPPPKIRKLIQELMLIEREDINALDSDEKQTLRKAMFSVLLQLED